jgi:hypothetical protein
MHACGVSYHTACVLIWVCSGPVGAKAVSYMSCVVAALPMRIVDYLLQQCTSYSVMMNMNGPGKAVFYNCIFNNSNIASLERTRRVFIGYFF